MRIHFRRIHNQIHTKYTSSVTFYKLSLDKVLFVYIYFRWFLWVLYLLVSKNNIKNRRGIINCLLVLIFFQDFCWDNFCTTVNYLWWISERFMKIFPFTEKNLHLNQKINKIENNDNGIKSANEKIIQNFEGKKWIN